MKNYLVVTLGTRDVQLNRNKLEKDQDIEVNRNKKNRIEVRKNGVAIDVLENRGFDDYFAVPPRISGKILSENYNLFKEYIEFPLFSKVIEEITSSNRIDYIVWVFTDQQQGFDLNQVEFYNYNNDTLFFKDIITKAFENNPSWSNTQFDEYVIEEKVADIDFQYTHFGKKIEELFLSDKSEIGQVFLLPQGGIEQINHAITLQLLQKFKTKVKLYQKAEKNQPRRLSFTNLFLKDLNRQKIDKHLRDYDFGAISKDISPTKEVYHLAQYAKKRLNLQYNELNINLQNLQGYNLPSTVDDDSDKLRDVYLACKINLHQKKYIDFLWRLYTINESLFKIKVKKVIGSAVDEFVKDKSAPSPWERKLNSIDKSLISKLKSKDIKTVNPNRWAFKLIVNELVKKGTIDLSMENLRLYNVVGDKLESLSSTRNSIAHKLGSTTLNEINNILGGNSPNISYNTSHLMADIDTILQVEGFGIFDKVKKDIETLL